MNGKYILAFVLGAALGSAASWRYFKTKYEQIAQEEIDSVKEYYYKKNNDKKPEEAVETEEQEEEESEPDYIEYTSMLKNENYHTDYSEIKKTTGIPGELPYVISPEEFGEMDGYSRISLTYYADQVVADDADHILEDVEGTIGFDSLTHFGEYEDDSVFVRNDRRRCDYEILLSLKKYSEVLKEKPYLKVEVR